MRKVLAVYRKELRQISRDQRTLLILVFVPAFFLLLYGYALNFDIRHIKLAVEDRDGTPESRAPAMIGCPCGHVFASPIAASMRSSSTGDIACSSRSASSWTSSHGTFSTSVR